MTFVITIIAIIGHHIYEHINRMITLTVITLCDNHPITIIATTNSIFTDTVIRNLL